MSQTEIIIEIEDGLIQEVFCSDRTARVTIVDWDTEGASAGDNGIYSVPSAAGSSLVAVEHRTSSHLKKLRNSRTAKALLSARAIDSE
jgi:hypothetical protein